MPNQYLIPPYGTPGSRLHGWLTEAVQEGDAWLRAQRPAKGWEGLIELLASDTGPASDDGLSNTGYNKTKRIARELVAALSTFRHEGEVKPTTSKELYNQAHALTKVDRAWYRATHAYDFSRKILQNAVVFGTSYGVCEWDKHFHGHLMGDVRQTAFAPADVTFIQLPKDNEVQRAYGVLIRYELPINLAQAIYGRTNAAFARSLTPDRDAPGWLAKGLEKVQTFLSPALRAGGRREDQNTSFPTVDIFHLYTIDGSVNETGSPLRMGPEGTNWSYVVPALGDPLPLGILNPATGAERTTAATEDDCLLFPLRRLTIFARRTDIVCSDDTSPWWHGKAPVVRLAFSDWPWEALGQSLLSDASKMQDGIVALMRDIEDSAAARLDPPYIYDEQLTSEGFSAAFNPRKAGARARGQLNNGDLIKFPVPVNNYDVPAFIPDWVKQQEQRMDYLTGVADLTAIAKARQLPSADAMEKLLEMAGPIVQDMVRNIEDPLERLGQMRLSYYLQFYTRPRFLTRVGDDADELAEMEFRPELIVPAHDGEGVSANTQRRKAALSDFRYHVTQSGITELNRMSMKLFYLQLMKAGFPISWWTFAKVAGIPNFGPEPEGTHTEFERWIAQQHLTRELAEELQGAAPGAKPGPGRPNTNQKPAKVKTKDGGTRTVTSTSG